jgi:hypothetical protein
MALTNEATHALIDIIEKLASRYHQKYVNGLVVDVIEF